MTTMLVGIAVGLTPLLLITALALGLAACRDRRRAACYGRQIELTEAIHRELGVAAAPVVESGPGGRWLVNLTLPLDQPALVTSILRITERIFGARPAQPSSQFRVVLTPPAPRTPSGLTRPPRPRAAGPLTPISPVRSETLNLCALEHHTNEPAGRGARGQRARHRRRLAQPRSEAAAPLQGPADSGAGVLRAPAGEVQPPQLHVATGGLRWTS